MITLQTNTQRFTCLEAIQNQQQHLVQTIGRIVEIMKSLPEGEIRSKLVDEISCLDVIAEVTKKALNSLME